MSKSNGEFLRLQSLIDKGYDALTYRYLCLTAHYRGQLLFDWSALQAAQVALNRLREAFHRLPRRVASLIPLTSGDLPLRSTLISMRRVQSL